MRNRFLKLLFFFLISKISYADNLDISAKNISIDKKNEITILKDNVIIRDTKGNIIKTEIANYNKKKEVIISSGKTSILTSEGYLVETKDLVFDNFRGLSSSEKKTTIKDPENNLIYLNNFEYRFRENIFKSVGEIKIIDNSKNSYEFSQLYVDEKKREIIGSDAKSFFNQERFKFNKKNKPRVFSNTVNIKDGKSKFIKSSFTTCDYRENDKCPPWELRAAEMTHDKEKKTIYYDDAVIRFYDIPIFYLPKLAHPDPTVERRSGFLIPYYTDTKNLGSSIRLPYFWAIDKDKDLTIHNRVFVTEHPLITAEYRQAFKNSDLVFDFGYTEGYRDTSSTKKPGDKSHFFAKFLKKFETSTSNETNLEINLQHVSNKKYLKLYKIDSNLVNYETETLENKIDVNHFNNDNDLFLSLQASSFRSLKDKYNDKYEYIIPSITLNKNLFNEDYGYGNFKTNLRAHNFDTNKHKRFLINDFDWTFNNLLTDTPYEGKFLTKIKNVNYEVKNENKFKEDTTSEFFGALGFLANVDLYKNEGENISHLLRPKMLIRYSPNHMRKETGDSSLNGKDIFSLDRLNVNENFESGTNMTVGLDYQQKFNDNSLDFSIGQIINSKKNNKKMPASSSLDKRFSDVVGNLNFDNNKNFSLNYDYSLKENYKEFNYSEIGAEYYNNNIRFDINYLKDDKIGGEREYFKTKLELMKGNNGILAFSNKRNLITNASEYYDLSYEYINDCLRAGLVYRREFYNDSELEPDNTLMFKITLNSFGALNSPGFNQ